jgi:predicted secreted protein
MPLSHLHRLPTQNQTWAALIADGLHLTSASHILGWERMNEIPVHLELAVGERRVVELPGLGTAGYVWDHEITGESDVVDVQWTRGDPPGSAPRPVGMSAPEVATIRAVRPGAVVVRLYQHRRWEPPGRVLAQHRLSVLVSG